MSEGRVSFSFAKASELVAKGVTQQQRIAELELRERVLVRASSLSAQGLADVHIRNEQRLSKRITELEGQLAEKAALLVNCDEQLRWVAAQLAGAKEDAALLNDLVDLSNDGHDLLNDNVWDCLPGGCHQEGEVRTCRVCWTMGVKERLLAAVETERLLDLGRQAARKERG